MERKISSILLPNISFFAYFIKLVKASYFYLMEGLPDNLVIGKTESKREEIVINFSG